MSTLELALTRVLGRPCGCSARRAWLWKQYARLVEWLDEWLVSVLFAFPVSDPTTVADWLPTPASAIGDILRGVGAPAPPPDPEDPPPEGVLPGFPGLKGFAATALNASRDLPLLVHQVTKTADDGTTGTFRDIIENQLDPDKYNIVIFRTGGNIALLNSPIEVAGVDNLYVAGQTAPGGGILLSNRPFWIDRSDDVVVRHMRSRRAGSSGFRFEGGSRCVYAHLSSSWSMTRFEIRFSSDTGSPQEDVAVFECLAYEPEDAHPTVLGFGGHPKDDPLMVGCDLYRSALMGPGWRLPKASAYNVNVANNIMYNWRQRGCGTNNTCTADFRNNYMKPGPATFDGSQRFGRRAIVIGDSCEDRPVGTTHLEACEYSFFVEGNRNEQNNYTPTFGVTPWEGPNREVTCRRNGDGTSAERLCGDNDNGEVPESARRFTPITQAFPFPLDIQEITDTVVDEILTRVGDCRGVNAAGEWFDRRDAVDAEKIQEFRDGTGRSQPIVWADIAEDFNENVPDPGTPYTDTNGDGIPDAYYSFRGENPAGASLAAQVDPNGYLFIENWLNGVDHLTGEERIASS